MQRKSIVLPAPEAPKILKGAAGARNSTSKVKSASFFSICTSSVTSAPPPTLAPQPLRVRPVIKPAQQRDRNSHVRRAPAQRLPDLVRFHRKINRDRNRLRPPGNVSRKHQSRAEFAERPRETQNRPRQRARPRQRHRHLAKNAPL